MNNPFLEKPSDLRKHWKNLRESLVPELDDMDHLEITSRWWSRAPTVRAWIDWDHPENWPDPWELLAAGHFDNSVIAIGMAYTLLLCKDMRWDQERVELALACDTEKTMQHLIVIADGRWQLNRAHAIVTQVDGSLIIQDRYAYDGKIFRSIW
jgi:hypothetical protein